MRINNWEKAQKKEMRSWLNTDMTSSCLLENWKNRLNDFKLIIDKINPESSILDIGSGPISVLHCFPKCKKMVALDSLNDEFEKKYQRIDYIDYINSKAEKIDFPDKSFDFITCINALDHMDNYNNSLCEIARCLKPGGILFLEYENTSPLSIFMSKLGYKKPLYDFHPVLIENKRTFKILRRYGLKMIKIECKPQLNFKKIKTILKILFSKKKETVYEKNISALNYGIIKTFFHYFIISTERIFFFFYPKKFGYFTKIIAIKNK